MHLLKRLIRAVLLAIFLVLLLLSVAISYFFFTLAGGKRAVDYILRKYDSMAVVYIGHYEGSLQNGFILKDIYIKGFPFVPDALIRIQEVRARFPLMDLPHFNLDIFNARIFIPDSDPLVFTGRVYEGQITGSLYASSLDLHEASRFGTIEDIKKNLQGFISNSDFTVKGPVFSPHLNGSFGADGIRYKSVILTNALFRVDLTLLPTWGNFQMKGDVMVDSGLIIVHHTNLKLSQSKFHYQGNIIDPMIDIRLAAKVEDMDIHLTIKGEMSNPQLLVSSDPPMPPQDALRVLFTNNALSSSNSPFNGATSNELAQNFLNYTLQDSSPQQNLGLKTKLTDNLKLGVEMEEMPTIPGGESTIYYNRKIEGEMDMTNHMSLNVAQQVLPQGRDASQSTQDAQPQGETQVYVQYKKRF